MSKTKMIAVSPQNWESLRKFGEYGDSMNSIISKVLDKVDALPNEKSVMARQSHNEQEAFEDRTPRNNPTDKEGFES